MVLVQFSKNFSNRWMNYHYNIFKSQAFVHLGSVRTSLHDGGIPFIINLDMLYLSYWLQTCHDESCNIRYKIKIVATLKFIKSLYVHTEYDDFLAFLASIFWLEIIVLLPWLLLGEFSIRWSQWKKIWKAYQE